MLLKELLIPKVIKPEQVTESLKDQYREAIKRVILDLEAKGLLGKHLLQTVPALQTIGESGLVGMLKGSLLGFSGRLYGEQNTHPALTFAWITSNEERMLVFTAVSADKLIIRKVEQTSPTISFKFNLPHFVGLNDHIAFTRVEGASAFSTFKGSHQNDYLKSEAIHQVIVEVDQGAFGQLQSLQFGRAFLPTPQENR